MSTAKGVSASGQSLLKLDYSSEEEGQIVDEDSEVNGCNE